MIHLTLRIATKQKLFHRCLHQRKPPLCRKMAIILISIELHSVHITIYKNQQSIIFLTSSSKYQIHEDAKLTTMKNL